MDRASCINIFKEQIEPKSSHSEEIKQIIEALLFSSEEPLSILKMREIINTAHPISPAEVKKYIGEITQTWKEEKEASRSMRLLMDTSCVQQNL